MARLDSHFETCLPEMQKARYYLEALKDYIPRAMFPGYFFLRCEPELRPLRHGDYRGLVGFGGAGVGEPIPIEVEAIEELRAQIDGQGILRLPELKPGSEVEICEGTFWGRRGLYECKSGDDYVMVLLNTVTRFQVEVHRAALRAVGVQ